MHVKSSGLLGPYPDTHVKLRASRLHAPLIERALELPFDIHEGIPDAWVQTVALWGLRLRCGSAGMACVCIGMWDCPS